MANTLTGYARGSTDKQDLTAQRRALIGLVTVLRRSLISLCHLGFQCEWADAAQI
jgi:hypothetical protein